MKLLESLLCITLMSGPAKAATTIAFDDLSPGPDYAIIQNGYGGLEWSAFGVIDGSINNSGYLNGITSSNNVAFNIAGYPASISRSNALFDLRSAYLTAAVTGLQLQVRGWSGPTVVYDNTYNLSTGGPTWIEFDYTNINRVVFTSLPDSPFVMDDLEIANHETPIPHVSLNLGEIQTSSIGHKRLPTGFHSTNQFRVQDYLVDQKQSSDGGGMVPSVFVNWDNYDQFILNVSAPAGHKFLVRVPSGQSVQFGGSIIWNSTGVAGGTSPAGAVKVQFGGLEGEAPDFTGTDAVLSDSHGFFGLYDITSSTFTNDLAFSTITFTGTVVAQHSGAVVSGYTPLGEQSLLLSYTTTGTNDPGRFVSIVPILEAPSLQITAVSPENGVKLLISGRAGSTNLVECSENLDFWTPFSTNLMPTTVYPIVDVTDSMATNTAHRYYRTFEVQ